MDYIIERTKKEHLPQIAFLEQQEFSFPMDLDMLQHLLDDPQVIFLSAVLHDKILGYVSLKTVDEEGLFNNIAVDRSCRGMGIGKNLLRELISCSIACNITTISLEVREKNLHAISLYKNNGFEIVGNIKNYYTKPKDNAIIMRTILNNGMNMV